MALTERAREILSWYAQENPGVRANIARIMNFGKLGGTGKFVILPVDQGFEHGPARSFAPNPPGYNPAYHVQLALDSGCNAYAAPLGFIEAVADEYAGQIPLILKINNHEVLCDEKDPMPALTSSPRDALRLGCAAIGFTIYPGSTNFRAMYEQLREVTYEAKKYGLAVVVWSYPRGTSLSKEGETAIDVAAYAAQPGDVPVAQAVPLGLEDPGSYIPADNPQTARKIELGRWLFFDKRLSKNGTVACATCHMPGLAFTDGQPVSTGIYRLQGGRSAPTAINRV